MNKKGIITLAILLFGMMPAVIGQVLPSFGDARSGTSGFQFMKISVDPRSAAMGNSVVADAADGSSLYWNPALAAQVRQNELFVGYTAWLVDVNKGYLSYIHKMNYLAVGVSLQYLDSGDINETTEFNPLGTGRTFRTVHYSVGLTVSQQLTDLFSYGVTAKFLEERIEEVHARTGAIDFGFFYRVGDTGLRMAVGLNNFGFDATPDGETEREVTDPDERTIVETDFEDVSLPTTFILGVAYDAWKNETMKLLVTGQLTNPSDNKEQVSVGGELEYMKRFYLRGGYEFGNEERKIPSFGVGTKTTMNGIGIGADASYSVFERLGQVPRFSLRVSF